MIPPNQELNLKTGQEHFSVVCMEGSSEVILVKPEKGFHAQVGFYWK